MNETEIAIMELFRKKVPEFLPRTAGYYKKFKKGEIGIVFGERIIIAR